MIEAIDPRWRLLVELLAATGLRINEALALRWQDIDLGSQPTVRVVRAVKLRQKERTGPPKSRSSRRTVPLPSSLAMALRCGARRRSGTATPTSCFRTPTAG